MPDSFVSASLPTLYKGTEREMDRNCMRDLCLHFLLSPSFNYPPFIPHGRELGKKENETVASTVAHKTTENTFLV